MQCPVCAGESLVMSERSGIEIDYCPKCRGVWLDRGELDKIIERSASVAPQISSQGQSPVESGRHSQSYPHSQQQGDTYQPDSGYYKKKKRQSFLGELFDFD